MKKGYAFAGSNAFLAEKISSVKEVMSTLEREFSWQPINWLNLRDFHSHDGVCQSLYNIN